ncbi:MAG: hypothetical protein QTN59_12860 [Candidatus Electrothrix communis]|nr:MAG: hypothetical protein QTN59_12860 [Candidatus Electrothrix communis]
MTDLIFPAIVVVGFNRLHTLERLLDSLLVADYPSGKKIPLIISLDYCVEEGANQVKEFADSVHWPYGSKEIILHSCRLGLKEHILRCGDLTEKYDSVIVLEDDLFVSPAYYRYSIDALKFFQDDDRIAGISLYSHKSNPCLYRDFEPLHGGGDNYFLQFASSWGQVWSRKHWRDFRDWYDQGQVVHVDDPLPDEVIAWPETSWLKFFIKYMVVCDKFFVYPRVSLSTNFGDPGTHFRGYISFFQVPILTQGKKYNFISLCDSLAVYDAFFELFPEVLNKIIEKYRVEDYAVDLYGKKSPAKVGAAKVLTTQQCELFDHSYGKKMVPLLLNVIFNIPGEGIYFAPTECIIEEKKDDAEKKGIVKRIYSIFSYYISSLISKGKEFSRCR